MTNRGESVLFHPILNYILARSFRSTLKSRCGDFCYGANFSATKQANRLFLASSIRSRILDFCSSESCSLSSLDFILYPCGNENFFIGILFVERDKFCKYLISPGGNVISGGKLCEGDRVGNEFCILYEVCYLDWQMVGEK